MSASRCSRNAADFGVDVVAFVDSNLLLVAQVKHLANRLMLTPAMVTLDQRVVDVRVTSSITHEVGHQLLHAAHDLETPEWDLDRLHEFVLAGARRGKRKVVLRLPARRGRARLTIEVFLRRRRIRPRSLAFKAEGRAPRCRSRKRYRRGCAGPNGGAETPLTIIQARAHSNSQVSTVHDARGEILAA